MFVLTRRKSISPKLANLASRQQQKQQKQQQKSFNNLSIALFSYVIIILSLINQFVSCTPPIDYFVYTSQLANAQAGVQTVSSILPSLESIYSTAAQSDVKSTKATAYNDVIANKVLSMIKNSSHTHDNDVIDLESARYAWHLMEKQALIYTKNRVLAVKPFIEEILKESQVSEKCHKSINDWLDNLTELKQWATLMWNSWGDFPPAGLFEGSYTDLGSYRGCLRVDDNDIIGQAQYCTLDFQPLVPTRPRYHSIFKRVLDVDKSVGQLIGGDFQDVDRITSKHSAHEFSSARFQANNKVLYGGNFTTSRTTLNNNNNNNNNKYNKRTIVHNYSLSPPQQELDNSNYTLKAEALVELAQKAQYFYYVKFRLGACLPDKCSLDDVQKLAQVAGQRAILQSNQVNCMKKEPTKLNGYQSFAIWVLSSLALIAVIGTVVDLLGFKVSWLLPFSMWTNAKRLFKSESAGTHSDLECIHGLRFFSMVWVIYGHTILYTEYQSFTHFYDVVETQIPSFILLPSLNANFSVDTFFVISGILTTYVTWEYTKGDIRKFNKFAFAISRYVRLTPQFAIVILCFFLLPLFGDGPMYKQVTEDKAEVCYKNWAINLIYMQSYINSEKLCIDPSWWLSIEMTFHLISMVLIVIMLKNPTKGMMLNFAIATGFTLWGAIIHYSKGFAIQYLPSIPQRYEVTTEQTVLFFHRPYPHAASYFIGIALGYMLANRTVKKLTKLQVYQGWFVCAFGLIISLWGSFYWNLGAPYSQLQATIYYNLCQILWPLSIAWIILACSLGHGGPIYSILTTRCFVPLGRITYMTYLSHALIVYYHSASMNIPVEPSMLLFVYVFIANTFLALTLGVFLTIVYESPLLNLQKQLFTFLTKKFDPSAQNQMRELPTTIVCDKNGASTASAKLLSNKSDSINQCNGANGVTSS